MGILETLVLKEKINGTEKAVIFRELIKKEMELLNDYCAKNHLFPKDYRIEFCHLHNIKKVNIARLLTILKYYDPRFIEILMSTDPKVRTFIQYFMEFLEKHPYFEDVLEPQNLFGNWDYIRYKLKILFPQLTFEEIDRFKFKRKEFINYVKEKLGEPEELIEDKLNLATWYESVPYLELESEMTPGVHPDPVMTPEEWSFIKRHIKGRKNIIIRDPDTGKEKLVYVEVDIPDEELDKYYKNREGLKKLLMERYNIDESGAEQILRKAGWEATGWHIVPPVHTDVEVVYPEEEKKEEKKVEVKREPFDIMELAKHIRYLGGRELEMLNYYELVHDKVPEIHEKLHMFMRTKRRLLGKLFGIYYTVDPVMAEAILINDPENIELLKSLTISTGLRDKKFSIYDSSKVWNEIKRRVRFIFPEVSEEEIEKFKGKRSEFVTYLAQKLGKPEEYIDERLERAGWLRSEEIPAFIRHVGP
ncbi:hypothetical protein [Aquifex aeolicus]|nr:hypothetical protein [Aquifex aeolicus]